MKRIMEKTKKLGFIIIVFTCIQSLAFGQQTQTDSDPIATYKKGKELFDNRFYGAAEQAFNKYLETKDDNSELKANAEYYIAISAMELFQDNAEALLNRFVQEYPVNPKARLANYYLGKFQYREKNYEKSAADDEHDEGETAAFRQLFLPRRKKALFFRDHLAEYFFQRLIVQAQVAGPE